MGRAKAKDIESEFELTEKVHLSDAEKHRLFDLYIVPNFRNIMGLTVKYTDHHQDVDSNYNYVLANMFKYIGSYDPSKSLSTWIHIVTKRDCYNQNRLRAKYNSCQADITYCPSDVLHQHGNANIVDASFGTLIDNISDEVYNALLEIPPYRLSPFLLYAQGMGIRDITKIELKNGHIDRKSDDVIKSRIYWARQQLQFILKKHGISKSSYQSKRSSQFDSDKIDER